MKRIVLILLLIFPLKIIAEIVTEDFEDWPTDFNYIYRSNEGFVGDYCQVNNDSGNHCLGFRKSKGNGEIRYVGTDGNGKDGGAGYIEYEFKSSKTNRKIEFAYSTNGVDWVVVTTNVTTTSWQIFSTNLNIPYDDIKFRWKEYNDKFVLIDNINISNYSGDTLTLNKSADLTGGNILKGSTNVPVLAFKLISGSNNRYLKQLKLTNTGLSPKADNNDIDTMEIYFDLPPLGEWSAAVEGTTPDGILYYNGDNCWTNNNLNLSLGSAGSGTNFIITIDISSSATVGRHFKAKIPEKWAIDNTGISNTGSAENSNEIIISDGDGTGEAWIKPLSAEPGTNITFTNYIKATVTKISNIKLCLSDAWGNDLTLIGVSGGTDSVSGKSITVTGINIQTGCTGWVKFSITTPTNSGDYIVTNYTYASIGDNYEEIATSPSVSISGKITIYDIQYTTNGGDYNTYPSTYENQIVSNIVGIVTAVSDNGYSDAFYIAESSGAWHSVFVWYASISPQVGDKVFITNVKVKEYGGLTELYQPTSIGILSSGNAIPEPAIVSTSIFKTNGPVQPDAESYESCLVKIENVEAKPYDDENKIWLISDDGGVTWMQVRTNLYSFYPSTNTNFKSITGIIRYKGDSGTGANGYYFLLPRGPNDLEPYPPCGITNISDTNVYYGELIVIKGTNFGDSGTVKFGSLTAQTQSWSSNEIRVYVPVDSVNGWLKVYPSLGNGIASNYYTIRKPVITNISPDKGDYGTTITITGSNFGTTQGGSYVEFLNENNAYDVTLWTYNKIICKVPKLYGSGGKQVVVHLAGNTSASNVYFTNKLPEITSITPQSNDAGSIITINGQYFGLSADSSCKVIFTGAPSGSDHIIPVRWTNNLITFKIPVDSCDGDVYVTNWAGKSITYAGLNIPAPIITNISPTNGDAGTEVSIEGEYFGYSNGIYGKVIYDDGNQRCYITNFAWDSNLIIFEIPVDVTNGNIYVTNSGGISTGFSFKIEPPLISNVTPYSAGRGNIVTINGTNFGKYKGSSYVKFSNSIDGGVIASNYVSWSRNKIQVILPYSLTAGTTNDVIVKTSGGSDITNQAVYIINSHADIVYSGTNAPSVSPSYGNCSTTFTFRVHYADAEGDPPDSGYPKLVIETNGEIWNIFSMNTNVSTGSWSNRLCEYQTTIPECTNISNYFIVKALTGNTTEYTTTKFHLVERVDCHATPVTIKYFVTNATSIKIIWQNPDDFETNHTIYYSTTSPAYPGGNHISVSGSSTNAILTGLQPDTKYYIVIRTFDMFGNATNTEETNVTTAYAVDTNCSPVTNVHPISITKYSITVGWTPVDSDYQKFRIYYSLTNTLTTNDLYVEIPSGNITTGTLSNLKADTVYYFGIVAYDTNGNVSEFSKITNARTSKNSSVVITGYKSTSHSITVYWKGADPDAKYFYIYFSETGPVNESSPSVVIEGYGKTSGTIYNLASGTKYYIAIMSIDSNLNKSDLSNPVEASTTAEFGNKGVIYPNIARKGEKIKFYNVKSGSKIKIYNIMGELVDEFSTSDSAHNENGVIYWCSTEVSAGVYIAVFEDKNGHIQRIKFIYGVKR